jgi:hypothetical protein
MFFISYIYSVHYFTWHFQKPIQTVQTQILLTSRSYNENMRTQAHIKSSFANSLLRVLFFYHWEVIKGNFIWIDKDKPNKKLHLLISNFDAYYVQ